MSIRKYKPEQIVRLLRQIEVQQTCCRLPASNADVLSELALLAVKSANRKLTHYRTEQPYSVSPRRVLE